MDSFAGPDQFYDSTGQQPETGENGYGSDPSVEKPGDGV
jgi:hypothetical protein